MKNLYHFILSIPKLIFIYINRFYNRLCFIFNKQRTIQEMLKPIVNNKIEINNKLLFELKQIRKENALIENEIGLLDKNNKNLNKKISILQELLLKRP
ncbi:hypothetical protein [Clostridium omnivorum]|uniref:Uncharacterized protein n=1 Tax=Clostridium omnivorum TaxID=1604902 RepID=A0ABQ5NA64_9CLOT|nr:hypothetical protein [Clostridium sp. E14]GLC32071.1 hypothetical protein bsdE14_34810 [Clostridium sp. E14]